MRGAVVQKARYQVKMEGSWAGQFKPAHLLA
jgi:hypothetical protein